MDLKNMSEDHGELHEFTVTLWKDRVRIDDQTLSLGALTTQVLNLDDHVFAHIHNLCAVMLNAVRGNIFNSQQAPSAFLISET